MRLHKEYHARNVWDGDQWVLWIRQGENEKAVFFDNCFPGAITRFAQLLDDILAKSGVGRARWEQVPDAEERLHEKELWLSLER
jgi:hypothetical protein